MSRLPCCFSSGFIITTLYSIHLEEFFYGTVSPEAPFSKRDSQYDELAGLISRTGAELRERLNEEEQELLERYMDAQMEMNSLVTLKSQIHSYKLGVLMTAEAFLASGELIASA